MEAAQATLFDEVGIGDPELETAAAPEIEIRVSDKRRKTIAAHWEGERIVVVVPRRLSKADRQLYADELSRKLIASREKARPTDDALHQRAVHLTRTYLKNAAKPTSVRWSTRQNSRWGSCTAAEGTIRISARLQGAPQFVIDAVLVHELAHLLVSEHNAQFYELANRFPRQHDADLFLKGMSFAAPA
ncbi:MAG: hypothetical protein QOJ00_877 [Actinomycetota bacterium]|jgi:predicted metal-dependent hydrolase